MPGLQYVINNKLSIAQTTPKFKMRRHFPRKNGAVYYEVLILVYSFLKVCYRWLSAENVFDIIVIVG